MPLSESMVKDIVQEVMAKMQLADAPSGKLGIFKDMNEAIEAAKKAQKVVRNMSLDQREKIISVIRRKTRENAELLARLAVDETGMGNVGHKILKNHLVADKTPGTVWRDRSDHSLHESPGNCHLQHDRYAGGREYSGIQSSSPGD